MIQLVTAVITTHKREPEMVERALNSVLEQTHPHMEVIVVDDSPADYPQRDLVRQLVQGKGVNYIAHETCQGACAARNTGLAAANGAYIAFLDDDDVWLPEKIEKQLEKMSGDVALVYCGNQEVLPGASQPKVAQRLFLRGKVFDRLLESNFIGSTSFPLLRKDCLEAVGGFDVLMKSAQDYDVWMRLAEEYEIDYAEEPLAVYYVHTGARISNNYKAKISGLERIMSKHQASLQRNPRAYWSWNLELAVCYVGDRQLAKGLLIWVKAAARCPLELKENLRHLYWIMRIVAGKE